MPHYIETAPDTTIFVEDEGEGQPVIFLHGWPLNNEMFHRQKKALTENGYRYIGIDLRGFGQSDKPVENYSYDTFASDIQQVIKELELSNYTIAGFSMGGPVALRFAVKFADRDLKQLFLLGPAAPSFTRRQGYELGMDKEEVTDLMEALEDDRRSALENFGKNIYYQDVPDDVSAELLELGMQASKQATISSAEALRDEDLRDEVGHVHVPVTIFHGKHDAICGFEFAEELEKRIPNADIVPFEESGHGLHYEEAEKLNKEMLKRLS